MRDVEQSLLIHGNDTYLIDVLGFVEPKFEAPGRRCRKLPGRIRFMIQKMSFDLDGIGYEIVHQGTRFRFEGMRKTEDFQTMRPIVEGAVY